MNRPRFLNTLHVRVTALFLGLLVVVGAVYYVWMQHTVFAPPYQDPAEAHWYRELAGAEIDSLARVAAAMIDGLPPVGAQRRQALRELARSYGETIDVFAAEVVFFDAASGEALAASGPADSLVNAARSVAPDLLADMTQPAWAFDEIYPDPSNIDAYINRVFHVAVVTDGDDRPAAYLAASWRPLIFAADEVTLDPRRLWLQAIVVGLVGSFVVGWFIMSWLTRRINTLRTAAGALADGRLSHRIGDRSADDLGQLGRAFNGMAAQLEELVGELRNKEQFQRQLIANISHDLRTPLASLRGYIETLSLRGDLMEPAEYQRYLNIINDNLQHLDRLVDHLLQLSRLDAGQTRFQLEDFLLPELVEGVFARCAAPAASRSIRFDCQHAADLPLVHADPLQIAQVLQNLIENAVKFGRDGGQVVVELTAAGDRTIVVQVRDDGPGIAASDLPHVFERFYTADPSRSRKSQGSGLGLAIAAKIVEGHGSRLTVQSRPGEGASFRFQLAAAAEQRADVAES
jgi:signal transduction histidine kinase